MNSFLASTPLSNHPRKANVKLIPRKSVGGGGHEKQQDSPFTTRVGEVRGGSKQTSHDAVRLQFASETPRCESAPFWLCPHRSYPARGDAPFEPKWQLTDARFPTF